MPLKIMMGDYTEVECDALVNFYIGAFGNNSDVSCRISEIGGSNFLREYQKIEKCSIGESVISTAYGAKAKYIIHTVAPVVSGDDFAHNLALCYKSSFLLCKRKGLRSIVYPLITDNNIVAAVANTGSSALLSSLETFEREREEIKQRIAEVEKQSKTQTVTKTMVELAYEYAAACFARETRSFTNSF